MRALGGKRQRGVVAIIVSIGLLALLAMVGLALDSGHAFLNKSRLQNAVDASALAAAKVFNELDSEPEATAAARNTFDLNAASVPELSRVMSGADLTVQFSNTLQPWAPGTTPAYYVRVVADDFTMWTSFTSLVGITETRKSISRPLRRALKRPSCGTRRSAMSSSDMTLMREITCSASSTPGTDWPRVSTPSMRFLIVRPEAVDSR